MNYDVHVFRAQEAKGAIADLVLLGKRTRKEEKRLQAKIDRLVIATACREVNLRPGIVVRITKPKDIPTTPESAATEASTFVIRRVLVPEEEISKLLRKAQGKKANPKIQIILQDESSGRLCFEYGTVRDLKSRILRAPGKEIS